MSYLDIGLVDARLDRESKRQLDDAVRDDGVLDEQQVVHESQRMRNLRAARRRRWRKGGVS